MPVFPNVPIAPGVPSLPRLPGAVAATVQLLVSDALGLLGAFGSPTWGLFLDGEAVVTAESVYSFDFKKSAQISSFPVENGGFESYNKVQKPYDVRIRFTTGGTPADRQELLESAQAAVNSLDLMTAVTPEAVYPNVNPVHMDYRRTAVNGRGLIVVDLFCEEVRVQASSTFTTNTSTTNGSSNTVGTNTVAGANQVVASRTGTFQAPSIVSPAAPGAAPLTNGGIVQPVNTTLNFDLPL
jgi:hypothetical protein